MEAGTSFHPNKKSSASVQGNSGGKHPDIPHTNSRPNAGQHKSCPALKAISMFSHTLITALEQLCPLSHNSCLNFLERVTLMHELYRVLSAISADTFSQHFRTYFIIPCNPTFYKHLKLLRRPEWNADIRTVRARQDLNIQKKSPPSDASFLYH